MLGACERLPSSKMSTFFAASHAFIALIHPFAIFSATGGGSAK